MVPSDNKPGPSCEVPCLWMEIGCGSLVPFFGTETFGLDAEFPNPTDPSHGILRRFGSCSRSTNSSRKCRCDIMTSRRQVPVMRFLFCLRTFRAGVVFHLPQPPLFSTNQASIYIYIHIYIYIAGVLVPAKPRGIWERYNNPRFIHTIWRDPASVMM